MHEGLCIMLLLDTNALIILMFGNVANSSLSPESMKLLEDSDELYVSDISFLGNGY